jgi:CubicO group peptidase (beta-lactamase class C family)
MGALEDAAAAAAGTTGFSGVVRVDRGGAVELAAAYGLASRRHALANALDTQFGLASGTKSFTAVTIASLFADGSLALSTPARSVLGDDLPLIGDDVTIEHLLAHRSGIGDYLDEDTLGSRDDYPMPVSVHELATTEQYLAVLGGYPAKFAAGERFAYCNGGYVVLALIAERTSGVPFHALVERRVCDRAGMDDTRFLRSDELPGRAAMGYLEVDGVWRSNVFHLPVRGSGDGGMYSTAADISAFWSAFQGGRIVPDEWVVELVRARSDVPEQSKRYGLGFWLHESRAIAMLEGCDTGVSFSSAHDPEQGITRTVLSNTSDGAWPIAEALDELVF